MKLLSVHSAKSIWLIPTNYLNPRGLFLRPAMIALKDRYSFASSPIEKPPATEKDALKFEQGAFKGRDRVPVTVNMTIHEDGIVIETRSSTNDGDLFLEDALTWISTNFGLPAHDALPIKKIYASDLFIKFEKTPRIFDKRLAPFLKEVEELIEGGQKGAIDFFSFGLSTDPGLSERPLTFRFERRVNTPASDNQYYSFAPIKTELHLKLLERLEEVG